MADLDPVLRNQKSNKCCGASRVNSGQVGGVSVCVSGLCVCQCVCVRADVGK